MSKAKDIFAKIIRGTSVPAAWVGLLLVILYIFDLGVFDNFNQLLFAITFLALIPGAAYPLSYVIPGFKGKGHEGKRNLAFIFTFVGYTAGIIYCIIAQPSQGLLFIFIVYFLSYVVLLISNKVVKFRASGHACGLFGPIVILVYFVQWQVALPGVILFGLVVWASLYLKRHTVQELVGGCLTALVAFFSGFGVVALAY